MHEIQRDVLAPLRPGELTRTGGEDEEVAGVSKIEVLLSREFSVASREVLLDAAFKHRGRRKGGCRWGCSTGFGVEYRQSSYPEKIIVNVLAL